MQPIEQCQGGPAILLVVSGDLIKELVVLAFAPVLVIDNRLHARLHVSNAFEPKERFEFLERVTRDPSPQGLTKNAVEIDEYLSAKKIVDLELPRRVLSHQLFDRALFVGAKVVHVQVWIAGKARMNEVDEVFESATLSGAIVRPEYIISRHCPVNRHDAEQKREPARRLEKRMSFEIQDHVACGALRQRCESAPVFNWSPEVSNLVSGLALELQGGLFMEPFESRSRDLGNSRVRPRLSQSR